MSAFNRETARWYLIFLWLSMILGVVVGSLTSFYEQEISQNAILMALMMLVMIPVGVAYLRLIGDTVKMFKYKLVFLLPLIFFPFALAIAITFIPISYLVYLTYGYKKLVKADKEHAVTAE